MELIPVIEKRAASGRVFMLRPREGGDLRQCQKGP
jgi:hypothetical protein